MSSHVTELSTGLCGVLVCSSLFLTFLRQGATGRCSLIAADHQGHQGSAHKQLSPEGGVCWAHAFHCLLAVDRIIDDILVVALPGRVVVRRRSYKGQQRQRGERFRW
ncbi:hypothetical protein ILYODFUR_023637 [Ilyodon furcidens]|uniref:Secreted protein n=1 Tax=Ilyodon furcidens TaxID=33524 RepID=A0ABV0TAI7_9TELE